MGEYDSLRVGQRIKILWNNPEELEVGLTELSVAALREGFDIQELFDSSDQNGVTFSVIKVVSGTGIPDLTQEYMSPYTIENIDRESVLETIRSECVGQGRALENVLEEVSNIYEIELPKAVLVYYDIGEESLAEICELSHDGSTEGVAAALHCTVEYLVGVMPREPEPTEEEEGRLISFDAYKFENERENDDMDQ